MSGLNKSVLKICIFATVILLSGCGGVEDDYEETTLVVEKKGRVTENIVEPFGKDYYDINELTGEFTKSVDDYNSSIGGDEIRLKKIEEKDSKVYVNIVFNGPSDYENFIGETLFVGTVSDAYDNGYSMDVVLKGVDSGDRIEKVQIMGMNDSMIVILSEHVKIKTFRDIAYVSANVDVIDSNSARILSESDGLAYLILK